VQTYLPRDTYLRIDGGAVVAPFPDGAAVDWTVFKQFDPTIKLLGQSRPGFTTVGYDGAYPWINPDGRNPDGTWLGDGSKYLADFYGARPQGKICWGAVWPRFNDSVPGKPGSVWDESKPARKIQGDRAALFAKLAAMVPDDVKLVQLCTWNDFDERTDIEFGIGDSFRP
jgi:hypothetical protein